MSKPLSDIEHRLRIAAPPEVVWPYLTEPEYVRQWLGCLRYEKSIDHVFYMQQDEHRRSADDIDGATHCRIVVLEPPERFAFTWYLPGTPETLVEIGLRRKGEETEVVLSHSGWDQFDAAAIGSIRDALAKGWGSSVLPELERLVESDAS